MRILIVSGIWPPEVGGPASHGPEFGQFLLDRGHQVRAVTTASKGGALDPGFPLTMSRSDRQLLIRLPAGAMAVIAAARRADVIYATGMYARSALASILHRVPLVLKLVNDPAYDRARSLGVFSGTLEEFQGRQTESSVRALKRLRRLTLSRASRVVIPSRFFADIAMRLGAPSRPDIRRSQSGTARLIDSPRGRRCAGDWGSGSPRSSSWAASSTRRTCRWR